MSFLRAILAGLTLLLITTGSVVHAVEYGGLGGLPANPDPSNDRTKSIFVYAISPGQGRQDAVRVVNNTGETKTIKVYAADSEIASGGSFACKQKVKPKNAVGSWVKLAKTELTLSASTDEVIPFEISVPANTSVGEHNGCMVIQEKNADPENAGNGVQLSFRSAIRMAITVPGDIVKDIEFTDLNIKPEKSKYIITARLNNKGNVSLDTDVKVRVKNIIGRNIYENGGVYPLLAQKSSAEFNFDFERPYWGGFYRVSGSAEYNGDPNQTLGSSAQKDVIRQAPGRMLFVAPRPQAMIIMLAILLVILVAAWILVRRILGRKRARKSWMRYRVREGDTLVSLARRCRGNWKTIAKVNRLKAPYDLKPGDIIRLPIKTKRS